MLTDLEILLGGVAGRLGSLLKHRHPRAFIPVLVTGMYLKILLGGVTDRPKCFVMNEHLIMSTEAKGRSRILIKNILQ